MFQFPGADVPGTPRGGDATVAGAAAGATGGGTEGPGDAQFGRAQPGPHRGVMPWSAWPCYKMVPHN